jgi:hypothetical protein
MALSKPYNYGPYNKFDKKEQWIRITEGCPHNCPFCFEPREFKIFGIPNIVRNKVKIMDMNLLAKPEAQGIIEKLPSVVNGQLVEYELICGIDYRFLTRIIAMALKQSRFKNIRIAWDWGYEQQIKIGQALKELVRAGYRSRGITIFMICNWKIHYQENIKKLDLCKVWNVKVADCYFDGQVRKIKAIHWTTEQIKDFRRRVRKHNQLVNFRIDPEIARNQPKLLI